MSKQIRRIQKAADRAGLMFTYDSTGWALSEPQPDGRYKRIAGGYERALSKIATHVERAVGQYIHYGGGL